MPNRNTWIVPLLILGTVALAGMIWLAGDIFALFLIAFFLAYILDPPVRVMERHGVGRGWAALLIVIVMVVVVAGLAAVVGPLVYSQAKDVFESLRGAASAAAARLTDALAAYFPMLRENGVVGLLKPSGQPVGNIAGPIAARVFSGSLAFASMLALALLVPIITFYLLKDWPAMTERVIWLAPPNRRAELRDLGRQMHTVLSAFLHGQAWICMIDAVLYSVGFLVTGLSYAVVIGMVAGTLKFLPYIGTAIGLTLTLGMALGQHGWDGWLMAGIGVTFLVVEVIENMLYPRLVGGRVKLPPALVIFAVLLGGKLMGVVGVFVAVPAFAVGRVVVSFWLRKQGVGGTRDPGRPAAVPVPPQPPMAPVGPAV